MANAKAYPSFETLGEDIKQARKALSLTRRTLAEMVGIDPRYLANIENSGYIPSVPTLYELIQVCKLSMERYFYPETRQEVSEQRRRIAHKLLLCPEQYLSIIEGAIDGAISIKDQA